MDKIPDSVVGFVLGCLKEQIIYNKELIFGAKDKADYLCNDLEILQGFVDEYMEHHSDSENRVLQSLINNIRRVVYGAEDVIERYIVNATRQKDRDLAHKIFHIVDYGAGLRNVGKKIKQISEDVKKFYETQAPIGLAALQASASRATMKNKAYSKEEDDPVGFDDEVENVVELLKGKSQKLEVISITGMTGRGKTTLAKMVHDDPRMEARFPYRAFIRVSQEYERRDVFLQILFNRRLGMQLPEKFEIMPDDVLGSVIKDNLASKNFLIVMDDVGTPEAWNALRVAFPNKGGSMVLITSQNDSVASSANPSRDPYQLRPLRTEECKKLLRKRVFGDREFPQNLEHYEKQIVEKCKDLPQKVVLVAGVLRQDRESLVLWKEVAEGKHDHVTNDVIGMCYKKLPYHLKPCFLYLGVFHEDVEIPVWKLLRLWIAEGFVRLNKNRDMSLEDLAEENLRDLVQRNLVMVVRRRANGQIKTCRIHDSVRTFCKQQAIHENLFQELKKPDWTSSLSGDRSKDKYRRLFINSYVDDYISRGPSGMGVRSFMSFAREEVKLEKEHISSIPSAFELLRVLEVRPVVFPNFPDELLQLVLLKYIAIQCNSDTLPAKLCNLRNLQTVIFETSSTSLKIEAEMWKMSQLRHLHTKASARLPSLPAKNQKGELLSCPNLQTLSTISPKSCTKDVFQRTPNIKKLAVRGVLEPSLFDCIRCLESIENLKLLNEGKNSKINTLPPGNVSLGKLTRLTLSNTLLDWKHMSTLGKLENLEVLKLKEYAFLGEWWQAEDGSFPNLKVLHIGETNLANWEASASCFKQLSRLTLRHCKYLGAIPNVFGRIKSLKTIVLDETNKLVASSAAKIELLKVQSGGGFELSVQPSEHLNSGSMSEQNQAGQQILGGNDLKAAEVTPESNESKQVILEKGLQPIEISQKPEGSRGRESQAFEASTEPLLSRENAMLTIEASHTTGDSRGKESQATNEISQESMEFGEEELPATEVSVSQKAEELRGEELLSNDVPQKPKEFSLTRMFKRMLPKSSKRSKCNQEDPTNKKKKVEAALLVK